MAMGKVSVAETGPPRVMTQMGSKELKVQTVERSAVVSTTGRTRGRVTRKNRIQGEAPSTNAASRRSPGTDWRPARIITTMKGNPIQASATAVLTKAATGAPRKATGW